MPGRPFCPSVRLSVCHTRDQRQTAKNAVKRFHELFSNAILVYISLLSCFTSVLINRLRIGHTRLTHSYLLSGDDQPVCSAC